MHQAAVADFSFAIKPEATALSCTSDETESTNNSPTTGSMAPLEVEHAAVPPNTRGRPKIRALGKKLKGGINKVNVFKWIDDLEKDQELADHLDRINMDMADERERQEIKRQAMEACMAAIQDHLMEFLQDTPQATYEEWICGLHPDNINTQMEGLTQVPMIDHRFYVADSDHRILWNEHLNDLDEPTNLAPVRHYVAARTFMKKPSGIIEEDDASPSATATTHDNNLIAFEGDNPQGKDPLPSQNIPQNGEPVVDLLSM